MNTVNRWQQSFKIQHVFIHPKYSQSGVDYDSALIQIKGKVRYNDRVRAACLPDETMSFDAGTMCTISGWGNVKEKESGPAVSIMNISFLSLGEFFRAEGLITQKEVFSKIKESQCLFCS